MKVGVCGVGRIGLPLALVYAKRGNEVIAVDINPKRIADINDQIRFSEPSVNDYLKRYKKQITFTTDNNALKGCDIITIIVNTPSLPDGSFDVSSVKKIVEEIKHNNGATVGISSNINIGTCDCLRKIYKHIACCPEFIAQGNTIYDFENPKFTVIGAYNKVDAKKLSALWSKIHNKPIYVVKPIEAEIIKLGLNVSYCLGIIWANIVGELSDAYGADSNKILDIMHKDWRNYKKGLGFAGPCFPRDTKCFRVACEKVNALNGSYFASDLDFLNLRIEKFYCASIVQNLRQNKHKIGFLGISYKSKVPYVWGSQALNIAITLEKLGYVVHVHDSLAEEEAKKVLRHAVFYKTADECIEKSDVLFIGTSDYKNMITNKPTVNPWDGRCQ